jgi:NAD-dependent dihydropyrimidine dehydrogenase PreA subunit
MIREIVKIDEDKCDGCGLCVPACAEGAIQIIDGKARLIADNLCDGLGACLGDCPRDAITIEKRDTEAFDEEAVDRHLDENPLAEKASPAGQGGGCPSARAMSFGAPEDKGANKEEEPAQRPSQLRQWPVQLHLLPPTAPFFQQEDLVLAADCAAFAYGDFHQDLLRGKALAIGCPKLDDGKAYLDKLIAILKHNDIRRLSVVHMEVPCCSGFIMLAREAIVQSGLDVELKTIRVSVDGRLES